MTTRSLFATRFYDAPLGDDALVAELDDACRELAEEDRAGRAWSSSASKRWM